MLDFQKIFDHQIFELIINHFFVAVWCEILKNIDNINWLKLSIIDYQNQYRYCDNYRKLSKYQFLITIKSRYLDIYQKISRFQHQNIDVSNYRFLEDYQNIENYQISIYFWMDWIDRKNYRLSIIDYQNKYHTHTYLLFWTDHQSLFWSSTFINAQILVVINFFPNQIKFFEPWSTVQTPPDPDIIARMKMKDSYFKFLRTHL